MSRLYIVSTPIGNLADITLRAIEVLRSVDTILAEDTRRSGILLKHHDIQTSLVSAHAHNEAARAKEVVGWLDEGREIAVISDAGTPLMSDPGGRLVKRAIEADHDVVPIPGPSAILAALTASGLTPEPFSFYGFTPRSGTDRADRLDRIVATPHAVVLFEAANRLTDLLTDLRNACGPDCPIAVARELTKVHETFFRGTIAAAEAYYQKARPRGEVVIVLGGTGFAEHAAEAAAERGATALARALLERGERPSAVAREVAERLDVPRNRAYELTQTLSREIEGKDNA